MSYAIAKNGNRWRSVSGPQDVADDEFFSEEQPTLVLGLTVQARAKRDELLNADQWKILRHRDQLDAGGVTTLTDAEYKALLSYRQALRDWPSSSGFPDLSTLPESP